MIWVVESPATPVWTRVGVCVAPETTVTVVPRSAWVGTVRPVDCDVTMSALAVMPGLIASLVWVSRSVTG